MLHPVGIQPVLADNRYLLKATDNGAQTVTGPHTVTFTPDVAINNTLTVTTTTSPALVALNNSIAGGVAGSFQRSGTGGTALQVGNNVTLTAFTVTAAGAFTASAASTINAGDIVGLSVNAASGGKAVEIGNPSNIPTIRSLAENLRINAAGASLISFGRVSASDIFQFDMSSSTVPKFLSNVASGANTGFTLNATNGPNNLAAFQSGGTTLFLMDQTNKAFWINGNGATNSPLLGVARNSTTTTEMTFGVVGAANAFSTGTVQSDGVFELRNSTNTLWFGPTLSAGTAPAPFGVTATFSGNNLVTSVIGAGIVPASVAGNGTAATNASLTGSTGGASSGTTGQTGGTGTGWTIKGGAGGAVAGASGIGGAGGGLTVTSGNGGNGAATGGAGGNVSITAGNAGTGGNAAAGLITLTTGTATGTGATGGVRLRNGTTTDADLNLRVLGAAPTNFSDGDLWITDIAGTRKLNFRASGVTYSATFT